MDSFYTSNTDVTDDFMGLEETPLGMGAFGATKCPVFQKSVQGSCVNKTCNGKTVLNFTTGKCQKQSSTWSATGCDDGSDPGWNGLCQNGTAPVAAHIVAAAAANPSPTCATGSAYDDATQECWPVNPATGQPMVNASTTPSKLVADGVAAPVGMSTTKKLLLAGGVLLAVGAAIYFFKKKGSKK